MRRKAKVDRNHGEIVQALRANMCIVHDCSRMGKGFPDILVWSGFLHKWMLVEIKDGTQPPSRRKLTEDQVHFHQRNPECHVVKSVDEALTLVGCPIGEQGK